MNNKDTCTNCGSDHGLHHYQTMQCPVGGEARVGHKQEWMTLTYLAPDERDETIATQAARIAELEAALKNITGIFLVESYSDFKAAVLDAKKLLKGKS